MRKFTRVSINLISAIVAVFILPSCVTEADLVATKMGKEKEIAALKESFAGKLEAVSLEISKTKDGVIAAKDDQIQAAADSFYGQSVLFKSVITPTRIDLINRNLMEEGWKALGNKMPSYAKMMEINERIAKELDETKTTLDDLRKNHDRIMAENQKLVDNTDALQKQLEQKEIERTALKESHAKELDKLNNQLNAANDKIIAYEKDKANDREALIKMKTKFSSVAAIVALAFTIGAVYVPTGRLKFAILAGLCALAGVAVWYIEPWHIAVIFGTLIVGVSLAFVIQHRLDIKKREAQITQLQTLNDSLILALQNYKETYKENWPIVAGLVEEQLKKYVEKDGQITTEENKELKLLIDKRLAEYDRK